MKVYLVSLLFSISVISYSQSSQNFEWIPFSWVSDSVSGKYFEKLAIFIPVTIDDLPQKFTMQFDLGAITTCFYENSLNLFLKKYPSLNNKLDTTKKFWIENK